MGWFDDFYEDLTHTDSGISGDLGDFGGYFTPQTTEDKRKQAERENQPTPEEQALLDEQLTLAEQQAKFEQDIQPFLLESMGLRYNAAGVLEKIPEVEAPPDELVTLYQSYLDQALAGEIPTSLSTENSIAENTAIMNENLSRRLGSGYNESTPGLETMGKFMASAEGMREGERQDLINMYSGLLQQRQAMLSDLGYSEAGLLQGVGSPNYSLMQAYTQAQQPYTYQNTLNNQVAMQEIANKSSATQGGYQLAGVSGGLLGGYAYNQYNQPKTTAPTNNVNSNNYGLIYSGTAYDPYNQYQFK